MAYHHLTNLILLSSYKKKANYNQKGTHKRVVFDYILLYLQYISVFSADNRILLFFKLNTSTRILDHLLFLRYKTSQYIVASKWLIDEKLIFIQNIACSSRINWRSCISFSRHYIFFKKRTSYIFKWNNLFRYVYKKLFNNIQHLIATFKTTNIIRYIFVFFIDTEIK